jgi:hypothetical protein
MHISTDTTNKRGKRGTKKGKGEKNQENTQDPGLGASYFFNLIME